VAGQLDPLAAARVDIGLDRGGGAAAGEAEALRFEAGRASASAAGADRVGGAGDIAVGETAFVADRIQSRGAGDVHRARIGGPMGLRRRAAIGGIANGSTAGRSADGDILGAGVTAAAGTEGKAGNLAGTTTTAAKGLKYVGKIPWFLRDPAAGVRNLGAAAGTGYVAGHRPEGDPADVAVSLGVGEHFLGVGQGEYFRRGVVPADHGGDADLGVHADGLKLADRGIG